jgi:hypothetical protein
MGAAINQLVSYVETLKMATIDECIEFTLKNIGLWWRYGISRHCGEGKYIIIGRIFESEIILGREADSPEVCRLTEHGYKISKVNFRIETKFLVGMSEQI